MDILIMESNEKYLEAMTRVIEKTGTLHVYTNFRNCIEDVRRRHEEGKNYDFAIIDLDLSEGQALQLARLLKSFEGENPKIKILSLSEKNNESRIMDFFSLPEDFYRLKTDEEEVFLGYLKEIGFI